MSLEWSARIAAASGLDRLRVLVVESHPGRRERIVRTAGQVGFRKIAQATDGPRALAQLGLLQPEIVLYSTAVAPLDFIEFTQLVRDSREMSFRFAVVLAVGEASHAQRQGAIHSGIHGFVPRETIAALVSAVHDTVVNVRHFVSVETYFGPDRRRRTHVRPPVERRQTQSPLLPPPYLQGFRKIAAKLPPLEAPLPDETLPAPSDVIKSVARPSATSAVTVGPSRKELPSHVRPLSNPNLVPTGTEPKREPRPSGNETKVPSAAPSPSPTLPSPVRTKARAPERSTPVARGPEREETPSPKTVPEAFRSRLPTRAQAVIPAAPAAVVPSLPPTAMAGSSGGSPSSLTGSPQAMTQEQLLAALGEKVPMKSTEVAKDEAPLPPPPTRQRKRATARPPGPPEQTVPALSDSDMLTALRAWTDRKRGG
ncbi:MAG: hypothetical protein ABT940_06990 [Alphaproteobacteria bacterium]